MNYRAAAAAVDTIHRVTPSIRLTPLLPDDDDDGDDVISSTSAATAANAAAFDRLSTSQHYRKRTSFLASQGRRSWGLGGRDPPKICRRGQSMF